MNFWRKKHLEWVFKTILTLIAVLLLKVIEMVVFQRMIHKYLNFPVNAKEELVDIIVLIIIMLPFTFIVMRQKKILQESQENYKILTEDSLVGVYVYHEGKITYANDRFSKMLGYEKKEVIGIDISELVVPEDRLIFLDAVREKLNGEEKHSVFQIRGIKKDKSIIDLEVYGTVATKSGKPFIMGSILDITDRREKEVLLKRLAFYDPLTGLPNRRLFEEKIKNILFNPNGDSQMFAVIFMDLDGFKEVNDSLGHHVGDFLLKEVAIRLSKSIRIEDAISRLGGDEFLILLPNISEDKVINIVKRIIKELNTPFAIYPNQISISTSIGIAFYPKQGKDYEALIRNADMAMYTAKQKGKNTYHIYEEYNQI